tara:strand:- start:698 stop:2899 length:2202 start_codon:yes stop_codon:yes gene_type:complete
MNTLIVGKRSLLSENLKKRIISSKLISTDEFIKIKIKSKSNLIINIFYPSQKIDSISKYEVFIKYSLSKLSKGLDNLEKKKINKIIYTSSSAVYGLESSFKESDDGNRKIYSASKLLAEKLIISFCKKNNIPYTIARVFNLYGDNDKFSVISKFINAKNNKSSFVVNNEGSAIRDFISYKEVTDIYIKILKSKNSEIIDVGTGRGIQIKEIINLVNKNKIKLIKKNYNEIPFSVADSNKYNLKLNDNLNIYLKKKLKLKSTPFFKKYGPEKKFIFKDYIRGTIIYGAGNAGKQIYKLLTKNNKDAVHCFVDDNKKIQNEFFDNKKIISFENLRELSKNNILTNIIVSIPSIKNDQLKIKLIKLKKICLNVDYLPFKHNLLSDRISEEDISYSNLLDIFNRKIYKLNKNLLSKFNNKTVLVTGAAGSIGKALCSKLKDLKVRKIIALDKSEMGIYKIKNYFDKKNFSFILGDINRKNVLENLKKKYKIDIIFHAAAYKHLNILEENICEAVRNNIFGTLNVLEIFKDKKLVIISTDKAVKPKSVLGITKRISEILSLNYGNKTTNIKVVRFGNVFASQGSAINLFVDQINQGGPVTLTNKNVERYFMSSSEAANLVLQGSQLNENKKILVLDMGKQIKLIKIIRKLIEIQKIKNPISNIKIIFTGLKPGEKLKENLYINKIKRSKKHKNILVANEPTYKKSITDKLLLKLQSHLDNYDEKKTLIEMKNFLNKEI